MESMQLPGLALEPGAPELRQCRLQAMLIVTGMAVVAVGGILAMRSLPSDSPLVVLARNPWFLLVSTLVVIALLLLGRDVPAVGLVALVIWAAMLVGGMPGEHSDTIVRACAIVVCVLLLALAGGFFTNFYASWTSFLIFSVLALILTCLAFLVLPSSSSGLAGDIFAAFGTAIFAIWTVKDVRECAGGDAMAAAAGIFLDLLNMIQFATQLGR